MKTYKIIRFYRDENKPSKVVYAGLTLEEAKEHCKDPETSTDDWFDGFEEE